MPRPTSRSRTNPATSNASRTAPATIPAPPPELHGAEALARYAPVAAGLVTGSLAPFRGDPVIWAHNTRIGLASVTPRLAEAVQLLPATRLTEVLELPSIMNALVFASGRVEPSSSATRAEIYDRYAALQSLRRPVLMVAQALASPVVALLDPATVNAIAAGGGLVDHAQDGVALASLFRANRGAITGRHPFTDAQIDELEAHGVWLSQNVTPDGGRTSAASHGPVAQERDAIAELARQRHAQLRLLGIALFGEDGVDARVPRLSSRITTRGASSETPAPPSAQNPPSETPPAPTPTK